MSGLLHVKIAAQLGALALEVELRSSARTTVLAGPNGAGKSTLLALILGLRKPARGRIAWGERALFDREAQLDLAPESRGFGWVPQGESLFPHLTALGNVEFGVASRHPEMARAAKRKRALALLEQLDCASLASRAAPALSGGERQRIALARALASEPRMLLLDEPLSALDANARPEVRAFLSRTLESLQLPALLVTHDPADAVALAERVIILEQGRVVQSGTFTELREGPATPFVRTFISER